MPKRKENTNPKPEVVEPTELDPVATAEQGCLSVSSNYNYGLCESIWMEDNDKRIIFFDMGVDENTYHFIDERIIKWNIEDNGIPVDDRTPITLFVSSYGGSLYNCLSTVSVIENSITPVITVCTSFAMSAAFKIFQAGHIRIATEDAMFLLHEGTAGYWGHPSKIDDAVEFDKKIRERLVKKVARNSKLSIKEIEETFHKERFFFGDEAKDMGIVDLIIGEQISLDSILSINRPTSCDCEECCGE